MALVHLHELIVLGVAGGKVHCAMCLIGFEGALCNAVSSGDVGEEHHQSSGAMGRVSIVFCEAAAPTAGAGGSQVQSEGGVARSQRAKRPMCCGRARAAQQLHRGRGGPGRGSGAP